MIGQSGGGAIAAMLASEAPSLVHSLVVLEPAIFPAGMGLALLENAAPVVEACRSGDARRAVDLWMNLVSCGPVRSKATSPHGGRWRRGGAATGPHKVAPAHGFLGLFLLAPSPSTVVDRTPFMLQEKYTDRRGG